MKLIISLVTIFIFSLTFLTELYLKKIGLGDPVRYDSSNLYGYSPKPNQKKNRLKGSLVTINNAGLRSQSSWDIQKKKIIFLGDSVTYGGSYIDDEKIFTHKVCNYIKNFICGNAGVNAHGVINIVLRSKFDQRIQDSNIFIYLFPPADFYREYVNSQTAHFYLNNKNFFLPAITEAISYIFTKYDLNNYVSKFDDTEIKIQNNYKLIDYSIKILKEEIQNKIMNKKKVYIFITNEKSDKNFEKKINKYIKDNLSKEIENIIFLNDTLNHDKFFYDKSVHLNEDGHEVVAKRIYNTLTKEIDN